MHEREARLVADRVEAPDLGDVDAVLRGERARDVDAAGRHIEVERGAGPTEVRPLRHRLEVIDRFGRFHLDRPHQLLALVGRRQHQIGKDLDLPDPDRHCLVLSDIRDDVVLALELDLQKPDDTVVLELLTDGPYQDWTHFTSGPDSTPNRV